MFLSPNRRRFDRCVTSTTIPAATRRSSKRIAFFTAISRPLASVVADSSGGARTSTAAAACGGRPVAPATTTTPGKQAGGEGRPDDVKALATRLRAKRRPLPLTSTTLASQIGVQPDELDDPQAAVRLAAWATAG